MFMIGEIITPITRRPPENPVHPSLFLACGLTLTVLFTGCGGDRPAATTPVAPAPAAAADASAKPATAPSTEPYSEGGTMKPFYGEVFHEGRYYLFGTKPEFNAFLASRSSNPLISKNYIGKGPNRETLVAQKPKESPSMADRLVNQFRKRHGLPPLE